MEAMNSKKITDRNLVYYLTITNFLLFFGYRIWQALFNNFAVEELGVGPANIGIIQAIREIPGLLGFVIGFLVLFLAEVRIMAASIAFLGAGLFLTGNSHDLASLLVGTVVMSIGFHFFLPSNNAVVLMTVGRQQAPKRIGQLRSLWAVASLVATVLVFLVAERWGYRELFKFIGGLLLIAGILLSLHGGPKEALPSRRRVVLRRRYWLFYCLAFLMGSRRHIFTTFAIFLLVRDHGISVRTTAMLFLVNSLVNVYAMQRIGHLIARLGERTMLTIAFSALASIFLGYAYVTYLPLLFLFFVLDNILFGFNIALSTYFQKIAVSPEEITSNLSIQQTINHISAIIVPIVGGTVWELFGSHAPFLAGFGLVLVSLGLTQFMTVPEEHP